MGFASLDSLCAASRVEGRSTCRSSKLIRARMRCARLLRVTTREPGTGSICSSSSPVRAKGPRWLVPSCSSNPSTVACRGGNITPAVLTSRSIAGSRAPSSAAAPRTDASPGAWDVVGDRWSRLLGRELTFGPRRYRDLTAGLPGIPSNVLAARLKDLQAAGVVTRRTLPAPTDVTVYELTGAGRALQPALTELLHWGRRYAPEPSPGDASQPGWALLAAAGRPTALPAGQSGRRRPPPGRGPAGPGHRAADGGAGRDHRQRRAAAHPAGARLFRHEPGMGGQRLRAGLRRAAAARRPDRGPARPPHDVHRRAAAVLRRLPGRRVRRQRGLLAHRPRRAGRPRRARRPRPAVADHPHPRPGPAADPRGRR